MQGVLRATRADDTLTRQYVERVLEALVALAALATIPLTIAAEQGITDDWLRAADWLVWGLFLADYAIMLVISRDRGNYALRNWFTLVVIVLSFPMTPAVLDLVRLTRLLRLARLTRVAAVGLRGFQGLRKAIGRREMLYVIAVTLFVGVSGGGLLTIIEPERVSGGLIDGVWVAIVDMITTSPGDVDTASVWGKLVATTLMIVGLGLSATLGAAIAAHFVDEDQNADIDKLMARLDRIERALHQLGARQETEGGRQSESREAPAGDAGT